MRLNEVKYTASVASIFGIVGLIVLLYFRADYRYLENNYLFALLVILLILAFPYFLLKFLFYVYSRDKNDELKLEELPKDQDDIEKTH